MIGDKEGGGDVEKKENNVKSWLQNLVNKKPSQPADEDFEAAKVRAPSPCALPPLKRISVLILLDF